MFKVVSVKLYNMSNHKQRLLDEALAAYRRELGRVLAAAKGDAEKLRALSQVRKQKFNPKTGEQEEVVYLKSARWLAGELRGRYKVSGLLSALVEGVYQDAAQSILSHFALSDSQEGASWPRVVGPDEFERERLAALDAFASLALNDLEPDEHLLRENELRAQVCRFPRTEGAVSLVKSRHVLIYRQDDGRYLVFLPVGPGRKRPAFRDAAWVRVVPALGQDKNAPEMPPRPGTIWVPFRIAMGRKQKRDLFESGGLVRGAKLVKRGGAFYLDLQVEFECQAAVHYENVLALNLNVDNVAGVVVLGPAGDVLHREVVERFDKLRARVEHERELRWQQKRGKSCLPRNVGFQKDRTHCNANRILDLAERFSARIILEDLVGYKLPRGAPKWLNRKLKDWDFRRLQNALDYKSQLRGLSRPWYQKAWHNSQTCPRCSFGASGEAVVKREVNGEETKVCLNHPEGVQARLFRCAKCGYEDHVDLVAAENLGRQYMNRSGTGRQTAG